jgi:hypothetical protein
MMFNFSVFGVQGPGTILAMHERQRFRAIAGKLAHIRRREGGLPGHLVRCGLIPRNVSASG